MHDTYSESQGQARRGALIFFRLRRVLVPQQIETPFTIDNSFYLTAIPSYNFPRSACTPYEIDDRKYCLLAFAEIKMADASTEPKLEQTETKPLHGYETAAEAPKETSDKPATVR